MIWLIGANGMLGTETGRQLTQNKLAWVGTDRNVDITNPVLLEQFANEQNSKNHADKIAWIINCSAYTAVDKAEDDKELAQKLNEDGPRNIASVAKKIGAKLIHISTDYVFDGTSSVPYTEDMAKKPIGVYGVTKAAGEDAVAESIKEYYILRTAWLYGFDGHNFVYTMTNLMNTHDVIKVVADQKGTPTCAVDLASAILTIIKKNNVPFGIYQCTDLGETDWHSFAQKIYELGKKYGRITHDCVINSCTTAEYPTKAKRPAYSVLSKEKIQKALGITLPQWEESLEKFIKSGSFSIK